VLRIAERKLKKQTQFLNGQIGAKSYMKDNYDNMPAGGAR
jgi:hypothetical protein